MKKALCELWAAIIDTLTAGDLVGHLRAWLRVIRGQVDAGELIDLVAGEGGTR